MRNLSFQEILYFIFFSFFIINLSSAQTFVVTSTGGNCPYDFVVNNPETAFPTATNFEYFWNFGDGHYAITTTNSVTHDYYTSPQDSVYVEITALTYTERDPPKRMAANNEDGTTFNDTPCSTAPGNNITEALTVKTNRKLVPEHLVTYIVTIANTCPNPGSGLNGGYVKFVCDSDDFDLDPEHDDILPSGMTFSTSGGELSGTYSFNSLPRDDSSTIFVPLIVKADSGTVVEPEIVYHLNGDEKGCQGIDETFSEEWSVVASHDPNLLLSPTSFSCIDEIPNKMEYTIRFQNIGNGPAYKVLIRNIIPDAFELSSFNMIYPSNLSGGKLQPFYANNINGGYRWLSKDEYLRSDNLLRGTNESQMGVVYTLDETVDSIVYEVNFRQGFTPIPCGAIINQAEIIFDDNPPIRTPPHIFRISCDSSSLPNPPTVCDSCQEVILLDSIPEISTEDTLTVYNFLNELLGGPGNIATFNVQWYPLEGVANPNSPVTYLKPGYDTDYFLVLSRSTTLNCERYIIRVPVRTSCDLKINATPTCSFFGSKGINASVSGSFSSLEWQDGSTGNSFSASGFSQKQYVISVKDQDSGCSDVQLIEVPCQPFPKSVLVVGVLLTLALLGYVLLRRNNP